ncbi:MAG: hypothetical protein OXC95_03555, partial [Dehalococcoidia bacterium]|nr:hypothetical protein [Dehalococcoidia bacterium]
NWTDAGTMSEARDGHTATLIDNDRVMVIGGVGNDGESLASAEMYDPTTGQWSTVESMDRPRSKHTTTLMRDGRVLVVGGTADGTTPLASVEQFDSETNLWTSGGTIKEARWGHSTTLLPDGDVLVVGGYGFATLRSSEIYKPAGGGWHSGDSLARWMVDDGGEADSHPSRGKELLHTLVSLAQRITSDGGKRRA